MPVASTRDTPPRVQVAIHDAWDHPEAPIQAARRALEAVLGKPVQLEPEWPLLLHELGPVYAEGADVVDGVAACAAVWLTTLREMLEAADTADATAAQTDWLERILDIVQPSVGLPCQLEVGSVDIATPSAWSASGTSLAVSLPCTAITPSDAAAMAKLKAAFRSSLERIGEVPSANAETAGTADAADAADGWSDVDFEAKRLVPVPTALAQPPAAEKMPSVAALPRPDKLFCRPPYHLLVTDYGSQSIQVSGSHSASLELMGTYFQRWCRTNHGDVRHPPFVAVDLKESCWGPGVYYDRLIFGTASHTHSVNIPLILAFVEGVLGYTRVSTESRTWSFRRDVAFV